jgi:hypothetical protein
MALVATSVVQQSYTAAANIAGGSGLQVDDLSTLAAVTETHVFSPLSAAVAVTTATLARFALPYACVITGVQIGVATAPAVAVCQFDVKAATVSVFTTLPAIDVGEFTTSTAVTPGVLSNTAGVAVAANAEIAISASIGSSTTTAGLTVTIQLRRTS